MVALCAAARQSRNFRPFALKRVRDPSFGVIEVGGPLDELDLEDREPPSVPAAQRIPPAISLPYWERLEIWELVGEEALAEKLKPSIAECFIWCGIKASWTWHRERCVASWLICGHPMRSVRQTKPTDPHGRAARWNRGDSARDAPKSVQGRKLRREQVTVSERFAAAYWGATLAIRAAPGASFRSSARLTGAVATAPVSSLVWLVISLTRIRTVMIMRVLVGDGELRRRGRLSCRCG